MLLLVVMTWALLLGVVVDLCVTGMDVEGVDVAVWSVL